MRTRGGTISFIAAAACAALLVLGAALGLALLLTRRELWDSLGSLQENPWWFVYREAAAGDDLKAVWRIAAAAAGACLGLLGGFRAHTLYRKGGSPILPFLALFLLSLALENLRAGTALLYAADSSISAGIVITRIIYWGRFVGLLALLISGLYCIDMKYRRYMVLAGVVFLVSFAMAAYIPVDRTVFLAQLTWKLGDEQGVWFVTLVIALLVLGTSAGAAFTRRERRFLWLAAGFALLLVAREILFFAVGPAFLSGGLACLAAGMFMCLRTLAVVYRATGEMTGI